ncbi:GNAT family N-acetyltransferase [Flectobacillus sp. DC10W]|uniref:Aminoglycoside N(6')-acetyltransferase type 1 n=1 Tax=Flectobacillus longus TaxID=2984207 RepID=A0ABT6YJ67_9BACT|nr:aminoglycoside 6'-N-acetyltransferase [Flectobacillus longus]MDI9863642.1 GNAT family N-acetyltransferase [Flectobacillus longus]
MTTIQEISRDNISAIAHLATLLWSDTTQEEMLSHFEEVYLSEHPTAFLLKQDQKDIGFIELSVRQDYVEGAEDLPVAYIEGIYVDQSFRKKGLAIQLIHKAEQWARSQGYTQLCSDSELDNIGSVTFHQKDGFEEAGRIICFVKNLN